MIVNTVTVHSVIVDTMVVDTVIVDTMINMIIVLMGGEAAYVITFIPRDDISPFACQLARKWQSTPSRPPTGPGRRGRA